MLKKLCKNISVIIVGIILITMAFKIGRCSRGKPSQTVQTVYKTDTLTIEKPKVKFKIIERIKWKVAKPETIQVVKYMPWMDSVWTALSLEYDKKNVNVIMIKDFIVQRKNYQNVPSKWKWYGTKDGDIMRYDRIRWDWLGWNKLTIGTRIYYDRMVVPYLETGIRIKKLNINVGIDKESIYADVSWRIW